MALNANQKSLHLWHVMLWLWNAYQIKHNPSHHLQCVIETAGLFFMIRTRKKSCSQTCIKYVHIVWLVRQRSSAKEIRVCHWRGIKMCQHICSSPIRPGECSKRNRSNQRSLYQERSYRKTLHQILKAVAHNPSCEVLLTRAWGWVRST